MTYMLVRNRVNDPESAKVGEASGVIDISRTATISGRLNLARFRA